MRKTPEPLLGKDWATAWMTEARISGGPGGGRWTNSGGGGATQAQVAPRNAWVRGKPPGSARAGASESLGQTPAAPHEAAHPLASSEQRESDRGDEARERRLARTLTSRAAMLDRQAQQLSHQLASLKSYYHFLRTGARPPPATRVGSRHGGGKPGRRGAKTPGTSRPGKPGKGGKKPPSRQAFAARKKSILRQIKQHELQIHALRHQAASLRRQAAGILAQ